MLPASFKTMLDGHLELNEFTTEGTTAWMEPFSSEISFKGTVVRP